MEQTWLDVCCRDPTKPGQPDACIFELAVAFGRGFREDQWRAVDHGSEFLERFVTKRRDRKAALKFLRKTMKRHGNPHSLVTDKLRSYGAAMKVVGNADKQEAGRWLNNRAENSHPLPGSGLLANHEKGPPWQVRTPPSFAYGLSIAGITAGYISTI